MHSMKSAINGRLSSVRGDALPFGVTRHLHWVEPKPGETGSGRRIFTRALQAPTPYPHERLAYFTWEQLGDGGSKHPVLVGSTAARAVSFAEVAKAHVVEQSINPEALHHWLLWDPEDVVAPPSALLLETMKERTRKNYSQVAELLTNKKYFSLLWGTMHQNERILDDEETAVKSLSPSAVQELLDSIFPQISRSRVEVLGRSPLTAGSKLVIGEGKREFRWRHCEELDQVQWMDPLSHVAYVGDSLGKGVPGLSLAGKMRQKIALLPIIPRYIDALNQRTELDLMDLHEHARAILTDTEFSNAQLVATRTEGMCSSTVHGKRLLNSFATLDELEEWLAKQFVENPSRLSCVPKSRDRDAGDLARALVGQQFDAEGEVLLSVLEQVFGLDFRKGQFWVHNAISKLLDKHLSIQAVLVPALVRHAYANRHELAKLSSSTGQDVLSSSAHAEEEQEGPSATTMEEESEPREPGSVVSSSMDGDEEPFGDAPAGDSQKQGTQDEEDDAVFI